MNTPVAILIFIITCSAMLFGLEEKTIVLQQGLNGYTGVEDAELRNPFQHYENGPDTNILILSEHCSACVIGRIAIRFDLSLIPADAEIRSATLELFPDFFDGGSMTGNYSVFQIAQPWNEVQASWDQPADGLVWANPGGDFIDAIISKTTVPRPTSYDWISFNVKPLVQTYCKKPAINYGFLLINSLGAQGIYLASSENEHSDYRPKLTVTYAFDPSAVINKRSIPARQRLAVRADLHTIHLENIGTVTLKVLITRINGTIVEQPAVRPGIRHTVSIRSGGIFIVSWGKDAPDHHDIITLQH